MAAACQIPGDLPLVQGLLASVDCNVGGVVQSGYAALLGPGSQFQMALTIGLTLYIAFFGLRLMLGLSPLRFGELTVTIAKIGVVLALATSWPTYQQLVVNVLYDAPQDLAAQILGGPGNVNGPYAKLQLAFDEMQATADYYARRTPAASSPFIGGPGFGAFSLNLSSMIMLLSTLGVVLASKIVLTALLAFGPVFITFFLFEATRGLFLGWLRAAILFAVAPLFALLALVFQLVLIEPQLAALVELRAANGVSLNPAVAILALTSIAAAVSLAGLVAIGIIATGLKLPGRRPAPAPQAEPAAPTQQTTVVHAEGGSPRFEPQPRAAAIAAAASAMDRRDARMILAAPQAQRFALAGAPQRLDAAAFAMTPGARGRRGPGRPASSQRRDR